MGRAIRGQPDAEGRLRGSVQRGRLHRDRPGLGGGLRSGRGPHLWNEAVGRRLRHLSFQTLSAEGQVELGPEAERGELAAW